MHMADALLSPAVGGTFWAATAVMTWHCSKRVRETLDDQMIPLMGVLGAFIFAAQMINFTIPGTGSSGHLGGGLLLAILLGPHAAFLVLASVLTVQALVFADGGLLALGANVFNLAILPCFIAYPLIYKPLAGADPTPLRITLAAVLAAVVGLQLGALGVVLETVASGISELPFSAFVLLMLPVHLGIGLVEGLVTAAVVSFIWTAQPDIMRQARAARPLGQPLLKKVLIGLGIAALITSGALSWFASSHPDGLEWAIAEVSGVEELAAPDDGIHATLGALQQQVAILPDYGFGAADAEHEHAADWPAVDPATSLSGLIGGALTLLIAVGIGWLLRRRTVSV